MLTSRQQSMLTQLIEAKGYIPIDSFTRQYHISARTVRHDLLGLEVWLQTYGIVLVRDRKLGVCLSLNSAQLGLLETKLQQRPDYVDAKQRQRLMLKELFQTTRVYADQWMDEFKISKNTLLLDLGEVKAWLEARQLHLHRERGWLKAQGPEQLMRNASLELLRSEMPIEKILQVVMNEAQGRIGNQAWNPWFKTEDAHFLFDIMKELELELKLQFSDAGYSALILHLLMAMERLKKQHAIRMDSELLQELESTKEFEVVKRKIKRIEPYFQVAIPPEEIGYITQHILGAQKKHEQANEDSIYTQLAKQIIMRVEQQLGHPLQSMHQIIQGLAIHLKPAIYRAKFGLQTKNPLMSQLETDYASMLDMIGTIVDEVTAPLAIRFDRDEVGYVVLHICSGMNSNPHISRSRRRVAIVCSSGLGTSSILQRRMESLFPEVEIVGKYSYMESKSLTLQKADAVLTMMDIGHALPIPWLKVSPLMPEHDQQRISDFLGVSLLADQVEAEMIQTVNEILRITERHTNILNRGKLVEELLRLYQRNTIPSNRYLLSSLLPKRSICLRQETMDWESAIRLGNQLLRDRGLTGLQYEEKLVDMVRSQKHHFIIHEGVAFPHASTQDGVWETGFSLLTFREPIMFGPGQQPIWLIITLAAVDKNQHVGPLATLLDALNDERFMRLLRGTSDAEDVWNRIREKEEL